MFLSGFKALWPTFIWCRYKLHVLLFIFFIYHFKAFLPDELLKRIDLWPSQTSEGQCVKLESSCVTGFDGGSPGRDVPWDHLYLITH